MTLDCTLAVELQLDYCPGSDPVGVALDPCLLPNLPFLALQIVLETEATNAAALRLYESLGFIRDKRLPKYYMNGNDAYRLKCWVKVH